MPRQRLPIWFSTNDKEQRLSGTSHVEHRATRRNKSTKRLPRDAGFTRRASRSDQTGTLIALTTGRVSCLLPLGRTKSFPFLRVVSTPEVSPRCSSPSQALAATLTAPSGAPGPDRIVFDPDHDGSCVYVGAMTHTGASSRNGFVSCDETSVRSDPRPSSQSGSSPSQSTGAPSPTQSDSGAAQPLGLGGQGVVTGLLAWLLFL